MLEKMSLTSHKHPAPKNSSSHIPLRHLTREALIYSEAIQIIDRRRDMRICFCAGGLHFRICQFVTYTMHISELTISQMFLKLFTIIFS